MIKKQNTIYIAVLTLVLLVVFLSGCIATNRTDLVKNGTVTIARQKTGKAYISSSSAYEENGELVITGILRRRDHVGGPIKTHVDVAIVSAGGTVASEVRSSDIAVSRRIAGRGYLSSERFTIRISDVPAKGSIVRLVSHSGSHTE
ncbi:MAG: hypothetical protein FVQ79_10180 [Planctomycetes bacterium]|nr:hypothetical protein [Planctomycetota bacterium]